MKAFLKKYIWLWEMIAVALIIACAILIVVEQQILCLIVGLILAVLGLLRIIPLIKTTDDKVLKILNLVELIIDILVGGALIYIGLASEKNENMNKFMNDSFGIFLGAILYLRGFIYFYQTALRKEDTDYPVFFIHIGAITLGTFILSIAIFNKENILTMNAFAWILFAICMLSCLFTGYNAVKGYISFRGNEQNKKATKKLKDVKIEEKGLENPTDDSIQDKIDININNVDIDKNTNQENDSIQA